VEQLRDQAVFINFRANYLEESVSKDTVLTWPLRWREVIAQGAGPLPPSSVKAGRNNLNE
jgi:hypothetical protein